MKTHLILLVLIAIPGMLLADSAPVEIEVRSRLIEEYARALVELKLERVEVLQAKASVQVIDAKITMIEKELILLELQPYLETRKGYAMIYTEKHPKILSVDRKIKELQSKLKELE